MSENKGKAEEWTEELIAKGSLMTDDLMTMFFDDQKEETEFVLRTITNLRSLKVKSVRAQKPLKNIAGHSLTLDVFAEDSKGKLYNIEVQNANAGAVPKRARYHSALIDTYNFEKGEIDFDELPETYVIMFTEKDFFHQGVPLYYVERGVWVMKPRKIRATGLISPETLFGDEAHIIYVNGAYKDTSTQLGKLIHDFSCKNPKDMLSPLKARMTYLKTTDEGRTYMKDRANNIFNEGAMEEKRKNIASALEEGLSEEQISKIFKCTVEFVQEVANSTMSATS